MNNVKKFNEVSHEELMEINGGGPIGVAIVGTIVAGVAWWLGQKAGDGIYDGITDSGSGSGSN
jgi:lactobin A/cerein 7B family class IIb bacteriocin